MTMMRTVSMMWRRSPMICVKSATTSQVIINIILRPPKP